MNNVIKEVFNKTDEKQDKLTDKITYFNKIYVDFFNTEEPGWKIYIENVSLIPYNEDTEKKIVLSQVDEYGKPCNKHWGWINPYKKPFQILFEDNGSDLGDGSKFIISLKEDGSDKPVEYTYELKNGEWVEI